MPPFRWPLPKQDIMLATEVAARQPTKACEWEEIARLLSQEFSTECKEVTLTGRACRERMDRLLQKYKDEDTKSLKKSGTGEEYGELQQLLHDIYAYRRDKRELEVKERELKKKKEKNEKEKAEQMRDAALVGIASIVLSSVAVTSILLYGS